VPDKHQMAVVDRIEDGKHAVLLVKDREERIVPAEQLPEGATGGTWLKVEFSGDRLVSVEIDHEETQARKARVSEKMQQLRQRGRKRDSE
jgi:hypothetical protein